MKKFFILPFLFCTFASAEIKKEVYTGIAKDKKKNEVVYHEKHEAKFVGSNVTEVKTDYTTASGEKIAEFTLNFSKSLNVPDNEFKDLRDKSGHGITTNEDTYILWKVDKDGNREEKKIKKSEFDKNVLVVGGQGLHYYLAKNLPALLKEKKPVPIKYLLPGALDYYSFTLNFIKEDAETIYLELKINSFLLQIFTSSLDMRYSKKDQRLMHYEGLSNLTDKAGDTQMVSIDYKYE